MSHVREKTPAEILMLEVGYAESYGDICALGSEWKAAQVLADPDSYPTSLVLALCGLDRDFMFTVSAFSHAVASIQKHGDPDKIRASQRKAERALDNLQEAATSPSGELRRRLLERIVAAGVKPVHSPGVVNCYRHVGQLIRMLRELRRVIARHRQGIGGMAPGVPELYERKVKELAEYGINRF